MVVNSFSSGHSLIVSIYTEGILSMVRHTPLAAIANFISPRLQRFTFRCGYTSASILLVKQK
jgi:hypothetical protein